MMNWPEGPRVVYSRGKDCADLAELVSPAATRVTGDLAAACLEARADLLISRKSPAGFDLVSVAYPIDLKSDGVTTVVAAVAGGPHSELNVALAGLLARRLNVEIIIATAYFQEESRAEAEILVARIGDLLPGARRIAVGAADAGEFVRSLPEQSLLVLGEAGGSFFSRLFFGPGARLRARSPAGTIVVRAAPSRVFQVMSEPVFVGPMHHAGDTLRLHSATLMAVVENGRLVGVVRRQLLEGAGEDVAVADLMEEPVAIRSDASLLEAATLASSISGAPLPVTDAEGRLVGALSSA